MSLLRFTIRRHILVMFGARFDILNSSLEVVGVCQQKAFKLKEDLRIYTDSTQTQESLAIKARSIIDFSAAYDVQDSRTGERLGTLQRKGFTSILRDSWIVMDADGVEVGKLQEDSWAKALLRRFLSNLIPQSFHLQNTAGQELARFHQHFNPFRYSLDVEIEPDCELPPMLMVATGLLIAAIEGRQKSE